MTPFLSPLATDQGFVFLLFQRAGRAYKQAGNLRRITVRKKDKTIGGNRTRVLPNANGGGWELRAKHLFISHQRDRERGGMGTCRTPPPPSRQRIPQECRETQQKETSSGAHHEAGLSNTGLVPGVALLVDLQCTTKDCMLSDATQVLSACESKAKSLKSGSAGSGDALIPMPSFPVRSPA